MNKMNFIFLFSTFFLGIAQADPVSDLCHEVYKLDAYRGDEKMKNCHSFFSPLLIKADFEQTLKYL